MITSVERGGGQPGYYRSRRYTTGGTSNAINAATTIASIPIATTTATTGSVAGG